MRFNSRVEGPQWLLIAAMFVAGAILWPTTPDRVPVHWNISGQVDRYGGKFEGLLLVPLIALGVYVLFLLLPRIDPGRANYAQFGTAYAAVRIGVISFMAALDTFVLLTARGARIPVTDVVTAVAGTLFIVVGSVLGKIRPNWFVGVRTPWTLSSKRAWVKTHRLGGWLFILAGVAVVVVGFVNGRWAVITLLASITGVAIVLTVYSYLEWRRDPEKLPPSGTLPG